MSMSDPLADMLTRIRNAVQAKFPTVEMPSSKTKAGVAEVLKNEGFIQDYSIKKAGAFDQLVITLKYGSKGEKVITHISRQSKPGLRKYKGVDELHAVLNGLGVAILSTSKGIITDKDARRLKVGGEVICEVW